MVKLGEQIRGSPQVLQEQATPSEEEEQEYSEQQKQQIAQEQKADVEQKISFYQSEIKRLEQIRPKSDAEARSIANKINQSSMLIGYYKEARKFTTGQYETKSIHRWVNQNVMGRFIPLVERQRVTETRPSLTQLGKQGKPLTSIEKQQKEVYRRQGFSDAEAEVLAREGMERQQTLTPSESKKVLQEKTGGRPSSEVVVGVDVFGRPMVKTVVQELQTPEQKALTEKYKLITPKKEPYFEKRVVATEMGVPTTKVFYVDPYLKTERPATFKEEAKVRQQMKQSVIVEPSPTYKEIAWKKDFFGTKQKGDIGVADYLEGQFMNFDRLITEKVVPKTEKILDAIRPSIIKSYYYPFEPPKKQKDLITKFTMPTTRTKFRVTDLMKWTAFSPLIATGTAGTKSKYARTRLEFEKGLASKGEKEAAQQVLRGFEKAYTKEGEAGIIKELGKIVKKAESTKGIESLLARLHERGFIKGYAADPVTGAFRIEGLPTAARETPILTIDVSMIGSTGAEMKLAGIVGEAATTTPQGLFQPFVKETTETRFAEPINIDKLVNKMTKVNTGKATSTNVDKLIRDILKSSTTSITGMGLGSATAQSSSSALKNALKIETKLQTKLRTKTRLQQRTFSLQKMLSKMQQITKQAVKFDYGVPTKVKIKTGFGRGGGFALPSLFWGRKKKLKDEIKFQVWLRRQGEFKPVSKPLIIDEAKLFAKLKLKQTLGATAKIKPIGKVDMKKLNKQIKGFAETPEFRPYKIVGGKKVATPFQIIQKRGKRLGTRAEVGEIQLAKIMRKIPA